LPAEFGEDRREEEGKGSARVDAQPHGDEGHGYDDPAVADREPQWCGRARPAPPRQRPRASSIAAPGTAYSLSVCIRCPGGAPRAARWMFSAMRIARASIMPSVQPDTCGVMRTLGSSWNGCRAGRRGPEVVG